MLKQPDNQKSAIEYFFDLTNFFPDLPADLLLLSFCLKTCIVSGIAQFFFGFTRDFVGLPLDLVLRAVFHMSLQALEHRNTAIVALA